MELDGNALEALRVHAEAGYPNEVCGLLLGTSGRAGDLSVSVVLRARNLEPTADRYMLDPGDFLRAEVGAPRAVLLKLYGKEPSGWRQATVAACAAPKARARLWDGIVAAVQARAHARGDRGGPEKPSRR